ncbi:MAG: HAMP domain-containing sensor histidine kinase [Halioglobus sp.]
MNFLTSTFSRRILLLLLPFTVLVIYGYSQLIVLSMKAAENRTVQEYLLAEYAQFERSFAQTGSTQLPSTSNLSAWWDDDADLPTSFREFEPGIHKLKRSQHLLVAEPQDDGKRAYFVLNEPDLGTSKMVRLEMESTINLAAAIVLITGGLLAFIVARLLSRPVRALAEDVRSGGQPGKPLQGHNRNDEIGLLSRAMGDLINRMDSALEREKAVTQYASHDMRTPVSVIRTALSVLNMSECDEPMRTRNLKRIDEACADIEDRIEVHLCLARESTELSKENCDLREMLEDELEKHRHTIDAKGLDVSIESANSGYLTVRPMLRIVMGNLIQNAVNYAESSIQIAIKANGVTIRNDVGIIENQFEEQGLGLEIVQRACARMSWKFSAGRHDKEFVAQLTLNTE